MLSALLFPTNLIISVFFAAILPSFIVLLSNIAINLGKISSYYEINYLCKLLIIEKSSSNFKKLSKLTKQNTKQNMWDLCREIIK
ncbi:MAG: hypothetical protein CMD08_03995 [Flavobacteriales bacterium]|nr:hypothetical protein [Flavobacteriales bacterium]